MASSGIVPVLTQAGLAKCVAAAGNGLKVTIAAIAVGRGSPSPGAPSGYIGYAPSNTQSALVGPMAVVPIAQSFVITGTPPGFQVEALLEASGSGPSYPINELGFLLDDGTLFAVWSSAAGPVAYATPSADVELALDLYLDALPATALNVTVINASFPSDLGPLATCLRAVAVAMTLELQTRERLGRRNLL